MKTIFKTLVLASLIFTSCTKVNKESFSYTFSENKKLNIEILEEGYMKFSNIEPGDNLVFEYKYSSEDIVEIADDEYSEIIRFEIDPTLTEFSFENEELEDLIIVFSQSCFCNFEYDPEKDVAPTGTISGEKTSQDEWNISIDLTFYGDEQKVIMEKFHLN